MAGARIDSAAPSTRIQGNYIGTNAAGNAPLGNGVGGIYIAGSTAAVGGGTAATSNLIAYNNGKGVVVSGTTTRAIIRRNSIHSNTGLGIDLGDNGVTPNDLLDPDTGPNGYQNFPVITSAASGTGTITVVLRSLPNKSYRLDFYSSPAGTCDPSHYGEGRQWIGTANVITNGNGVWTGTVTSILPFLAGQGITATATYAPLEHLRVQLLPGRRLKPLHRSCLATGRLESLPVIKRRRPSFEGRFGHSMHYSQALKSHSFSVCCSCVRLFNLYLLKMLCRWYLTVSGEMYMRAPIWRFE